MPTRNVNLTPHFDRYIESGVSSGRYSNASEMIREGLRLLEQREQEDAAKLAWLRGAVREGIEQLDRGEGITFSSVDELETYIGRMGDEVLAELEAEQTRA